MCSKLWHVGGATVKRFSALLLHGIIDFISVYYLEALVITSPCLEIIQRLSPLSFTIYQMAVPAAIRPSLCDPV